MDEMKNENQETTKSDGISKAQKMVRIIVAVVIVVAIGIAVYAGTKVSKVKKTEVDEENLDISEETEEKLADDYLNVAVFGINDVGDKKESVDGDAVYVVSLNRNTKEVKLLPVYGNAMMKHEGKTVKMKEAYAQGGAEEAIAVLNETLNLNIKEYVTLNFAAVVEAIDELGGIEIDVKKDEIPHINGYAENIAKALGKSTKKIEKEGKQKLDGVQATGYCRIRVTDGGDVARTGRQQEVINQILLKMEEADYAQADKILDIIFPQIETNVEKSELIGYAGDASTYNISLIAAYPRAIKEQKRTEKKEEEQFADFEEVVEGIDTEKDVQDIHQELFPDKEAE